MPPLLMCGIIHHRLSLQDLPLSYARVNYHLPKFDKSNSLFQSLLLHFPVRAPTEKRKRNDDHATTNYRCA